MESFSAHTEQNSFVHLRFAGFFFGGFKQQDRDPFLRIEAYTVERLPCIILKTMFTFQPCAHVQ